MTASQNEAEREESSLSLTADNCRDKESFSVQLLGHFPDMTGELSQKKGTYFAVLARQHPSDPPYPADISERTKDEPEKLD